MPELDDFQAAKSIRDHEMANQLGRTPIIALTAGAIVGEREKCIHAGMDDYITKPIDRKELVAKLMEHLQKLKIEQSTGFILPASFSVTYGSRMFREYINISRLQDQRRRR